MQQSNAEGEEEPLELEDEALDLTDAVADEPVQQTAPKHEVEDDLIDIEKFSESGEVDAADPEDVEKARQKYAGEAKEDAPVADEDKKNPEAGDEDIDVDSLMAEVAAEDEQAAEEPKKEETTEEPKAEGGESKEKSEAKPAEGEEKPEDASAEEKAEPKGEEAKPAEPAEEKIEDTAEDKPDEGEKAAAVEAKEEEPKQEEAKDDKPAEKPAEQAAKQVHLKTVPGPAGLQVSFPTEVLAEALRPLVKDWLHENLPDVVDRLVKEELSKLAEK